MKPKRLSDSEIPVWCLLFLWGCKCHRQALISGLAFLFFLVPCFSLVVRAEKESSEKPRVAKPSPLVSPEIIKSINKQVAGIQWEEADSYYQVLKQAEELPEEVLDQNYQELIRYRQSVLEKESGSKKPFSLFVDLFQHPEAYQGMAVELTGHARKIIEYPASKNDFRINRLYECWLYTEDSQSNPAVIMTTEVPEGIPMGEDLKDPVEVISVTGIFYRKYIYSAQDTMRMAPMIMAKTLKWKPVVPKEKTPLGRPGLITIIVGFFLIFLVLYRLGNTKTDASLIAKDRVIDEPTQE